MDTFFVLALSSQDFRHCVRQKEFFLYSCGFFAQQKNTARGGVCLYVLNVWRIGEIYALSSSRISFFPSFSGRGSRNLLF